MKKLGSILAFIPLIASCGGPDSSSTLAIKNAIASTPVFPTSVSLRHYPTMVQGNLYSSRQEMVDGLPVTSGIPYGFASVYSVTIPGVQPTDIIQCIGQAEITNDLGYNVQVARVIALGTTSIDYPTIVHPTTAENVTPDRHHMVVNVTTYDTGRSGSVTYSVVLSAASTSAVQGAALQVEAGYGGLWCHVMHQ